MVKRIFLPRKSTVLSAARRFRRRFTSPGLFVLTLMAMTALVGLNTRQTSACQAFLFLFGLLLTSFITGRLSTPLPLVGRRETPKFATVNRPLAYKICLRNETNKTQTGLFVTERHGPSDNRQALFKDVALPPLPANSEVEIAMEMTPLRRGRLRLPGILISASDPLGLCKSFLPIDIPQFLTVLPQRYPLASSFLPGVRRYQRGGVSWAFSVGEAEEFLSLRDYRPGDPLRRIYWKGFAKSGKPIVKEYAEEFFVRHALVLDTFQKSEAGKSFEDAVSIAASFACCLAIRESLLELLFVGTEVHSLTAGRGVTSTDKILEILASVQPCRDKPFNTLLAPVLEKTASLSGCICIFLDWDKDRQNLIMRLKTLHIPVLALVVGKPGFQPTVDRAYRDCVRILQTGKIAEGLSGL